MVIGSSAIIAILCVEPQAEGMAATIAAALPRATLG